MLFKLKILKAAVILLQMFQKRGNFVAISGVYFCVGGWGQTGHSLIMT